MTERSVAHATFVIERSYDAAPGRSGSQGPLARGAGGVGVGRVRARLETSWATDPTEDMVAILLTERAMDSPAGQTLHLDFWTSAYQAIDD